MIKLAEANHAIVAAQEYARDRGYSISVTVCDSMGHLIAHQRMDDALLLSGYGSVGKAIASAGLGIPSGEESDVDLKRSSVSGVLAHGLAVIRRPGGLPIKRGGKVEGAIGVSGAPTDEQDEECARRGVEVIGPIKHKAERESI
jgi:uncharacterized protein GlcG (DUF336 family)